LAAGADSLAVTAAVVDAVVALLALLASLATAATLLVTLAAEATASSAKAVNENKLKPRLRTNAEINFFMIEFLY
jgi:hypothetical protein